MGGSPSYLILEARFLAGTYGGHEWPPAPFRLFQAIVAGCRGIDVPGLDWLEQQPPPSLLATDEPARAEFSRSIPNNADPRKTQSALSMRDVIVRRVDTPVWYCWPLHTAADREAADRVCTAATQVHTLGVGEDMCAVRGLVADAAPQSADAVRLWVPDERRSPGVLADTGVFLRVAVPGSLHSLEQRFQAFQQRLSAGELGYARPVSAPALHRVVAYLPSGAAPRCAVLPLRLLAPDGGSRSPAFRPEDAVVIAGMLRHASMRLAGSAAPALADFAAGHAPGEDRDRRMSWVPLPSIGHGHADGLVRRALWLARARDAAALDELAQHVPEEGQPLVDETSGQCVAMAAPAHADEEPVLRHYLAPSRHWVSVTPVVLPGEYGGGDLRVMNKLFAKALREAGLDAGLLEAVEFSKSPFLRQAARLRDTRLKAWQATNLILYHVRMRLHQAVRGPLVLGRGRHFGLGLLAADPK